MHERLWYTAPGRDWLEGLPIGTGRLAAMILGTHKRERVALNHEWLWKGENRDRENRVAAESLPAVRDLLLAGKYREGTKAGNDAFGNFQGRRLTEAPRNRVDPYQPAGDLYIETTHGVVSDYKRELDLATATATVRYGADRRSFERTYMPHLVKDLILIRYSAGDEPFDLRFWLDRTADPDCELTFESEPGLISMDGRIKDGIDFRVETRFWCDHGDIRRDPRGGVWIVGTKQLVLAVDIGTSALGGDPRLECSGHRLDCGERFPDWDKLMSEHTEEHARHYGGMSLHLPLPEPDLPTDRRMATLRAGGKDPGLVLTYFNYGRYLLCACSANGSLPANLQGKWNEDLNPPWECDYHHDINLQMNYWIAEPTGMQDYTESLLQHIERFVPHARSAAKDLYGCEGVWFPIQTDAWGRATPESYGWAAWIGAAAWLAEHMWWHWEYGRDLDFLRQRAYPFLRAVCRFYESYLIEDEKGQLQIVPSQSPENRFVETGEGLPVSLCVSAAMDVELATESLAHAIRAAEMLGVDEDRRERWRSMIDKLPALGIGSKGQLLEWNREFEEQEPGHRHISHLVGFYPGEQIHPERTPALFDAALTSLRLRLANDGGHTGWSRAWTACCFARAGLGDEAFGHLEHLIADFATDTLLDLHPPRIFQIDGNLGGAAAIVEMLLQSYYEELDFLPALPESWPSGEVLGLRARGGFRVDIRWKDRLLVEARVTPVETTVCRIYHRDRILTVFEGDVEVPTSREGTLVGFDAEQGRTYRIRA